MLLVRALFAAAILLQAVPVGATAPGRSIMHYTHQSWSEESDAPRPVFAMAQDRSGYLWVAAARGLFRFDGMRFEQVSAGVDLTRHGPPSALLVRRNGEVWTNFERSGRFAVYRDGQLRWLRAPPAPDRVMTMREAPDGTVWILTERIGLPLLRYRNGRWTSFGADKGAPTDNPFSLVLTRAGDVWLSFSGSIARLGPDDRFHFLKRDVRATGRLSIDPEERIWVTDRRGSYPITGPGARGSPPPLRYAYRTDAAEIRGAPAFDREGNLWIATYYDGLQRVARPDPRGAASPAEAVARVERFTTRDGLTSNVTAQIVQDAEGNVFSATENGIDRFWPATLRFEPQLTQTAAFGDLLLRASDGSVYIGQASTVWRVPPGGAPEPIFRTPVEPRTLCEAPDGAIWIGLTKDKALFVWQGGKVRRLPDRVPLTYTVYDCAFDARGDYWVTASAGGMARRHDGRWQRMFGPTGQRFMPKSMVSDADGNLFVHWNDRLLSHIGASAHRSVPIPTNGHPPNELSLYPTSAGTLLVGSDFGLARLRGGRFDFLSSDRVPQFGGINGMVQTSRGETWLAGNAGIVRLPSAALERAFDGAKARLPMQVFGAVDGLLSRPHSHSRRAIVEGGDGRLWIATQTGTLWLDPADVSRSRLSPRISVGALVADKVYRDPARVSLPAGTRDIQIDFAVLNFSNPRVAHVRYRIEGQDEGWVEAGTRRQAFYTNLLPGTYRFRVIAANDDGVWNDRGATVSFVIPPTFVQSWWFTFLCGILALLLLWVAYRLRMMQVAARIRSRLEARLGERERIARELHDTLLQSVQGLVLKFQSVANKMPGEASLRGQLDAALERADQVIAEGRDRVQDLRTSDSSGDLAEHLRERAVAARLGPAITLRIVVEGQARAVHPLVSLEIGRIVDEALFNVERHARASAVDIAVRYGASQLDVEVRDDGVGMSPEQASKGSKDGHFGLVGMRERAERIGASLAVDSRPGMGCAVTIALPGRLAYRDHGRRRKRLAIFGRKKEQEVDHA